MKANFQKNVKIQHTTLERYLGGKRFGVVQLCLVVCFDRFRHILGLDEFLCTNDILNSGSRGGREKANRRMKNKKCPSADHVWPEVRFGLNKFKIAYYWCNDFSLTGVGGEFSSAGKIKVEPEKLNKQFEILGGIGGVGDKKVAVPKRSLLVGCLNVDQIQNKIQEVEKNILRRGYKAFPDSLSTRGDFVADGGQDCPRVQRRDAPFRDAPVLGELFRCERGGGGRGKYTIERFEA